MRHLGLYSILFACIFSLCIGKAQAQLITQPLQYNAVLQQYAPQAGKPKPKLRQGPPVVQKLPFFEDFSNSSVYPRDTMWLDEYVYVNNTFGKNPPSTGVASFDGLNQYGAAYKAGASESVSQACDTLTSTYIDLSTYQNKDSLYLSFFYQPGGFGEHPERTDSRDSFVLEFKADSLFNGTDWVKNAWYPVWTAKGSVADLPFKEIMIPLLGKTDTLLFYDKFQFRFINYGNPSGNLDIWNLDYIYLNSSRNYLDTAYEDVAVYYPVPSLSKHYYATTWNQFSDNLPTELVDSVPIFGKNNAGQVKNVTFGYDVSTADGSMTLAQKFNTQGDNLDAGEHRKFQLPIQFDTYPADGDNLTLLVRTTISNLPDDYRMNDTAVRKQLFSNYLAYDDGTAEGGISIANARNAKLAVRFSINKPDTLYGVAIFFNQSLDYVGAYNFTVAFWNKITAPNTNENDKPDAEIDYIKPQYLKMHNGFAYFEFANPIPVQNQFYLGWTQSTVFNLNVGLDQNYTMINGDQANNNLFYSYKGQWETAASAIPPIKGAPMIRAIVGRKGYVAAVQEFRAAGVDANVFPNPSNGFFTLTINDSKPYQLSLTDIQGRVIDQKNEVRNNEQLNYSQLKPGVYFLQLIQPESGQSAVKKLIIR